MGGGYYRIGRGVSSPVATYDPDPMYSGEARKQKYQGTVILWLLIGADGLPHQMKVQLTLRSSLRY